MQQNRAEAHHQFVVAKPVAQVFGLFDPIAEQEWVPYWTPQSVYPQALSLEEGSVFFLDREGRREVWTVLRHDPKSNVADYLATSPDYQQRWITVKCESVEDGTLVDVRYRVTALSTAGQQDLDKFDNAFIQAWERPVAEALGL